MIASLDGGVDMHKDNCLYVFFTNDEEFHALKQYDEEHHTKYAKALRNGGKTASLQLCLVVLSRQWVRVCGKQWTIMIFM